MAPSQYRTLNVRIPEILRARIDAYVKKTKAESPKYSLNDFFLEAARLKVDGPTITEMRKYDGVGGTIIDASAPGGGIHRGVPPRSDNDFSWDDWTVASKALDPEAREESFRDTLRDRQALGLTLHPKWNKMNPGARMAWLRLNDGKRGGAAW